MALCVPRLLVAQTPVQTDTSSAAHGRFFTGHDAVVAGLFAIGTVSVFPMVALERLYDDKHWASDVVLAAAIAVSPATTTSTR